MKKALNITVAGTLFTIEEDAYNALDSYLKSVQAHFGSDPDKAEIIKDIEARVAEQLMERKGENGIVSLAHIEEMIAVMGRVDDFGDAGDNASGKAYEAKRKLYRNPDDAVIAGVCSGIAAYFGLDPVLVRLVFVILVLLGFGAGVVIYIILALVIPRAETPAEKLQMRGGPVTLDAFKENVEAEIAKLNKKEPALRRSIDSAFRLIGKLARLALKLLRLLAGVGFSAGALFAGVASTFAFVNLVVNTSTVFMDFPIYEAVSHSAYLTLISCAYILVLIPVIFVGALGLRILGKRKALNGAWTAGLGALWIVSLIVFGSVAVGRAPAIVEKARLIDEARAERGLESFSHEWDDEVLVRPLPPSPIGA